MPNHPTRDDIDLLDGAFHVDPAERYAWMHEHAPVYFDARNGVWGVASYEGVLTIEKDPVTFSNAQGTTSDGHAFPMMIDMDDPDHWKRRKLVNKGFTPARTRAQADRIRDVCDAIIDTVCADGTCDFVTQIAALLPLIVIGDMLGAAPEDRGQLLEWSDDLICALNANASDAQIQRAESATAAYSVYCAHAIAERQRSPSDDLLSVLVHAEVDGDRLSTVDVTHESLLILIAGDETTRHVISGGMEQLIRHADQRQTLIADPGKIARAVEEMVRWVSPVKSMMRTVTTNTTFMGHELRRGEKCMLLYEAANRDPKQFDDPFRFDIERQPNEHIAFGFGPHYCLGQALARTELSIMFERLLARMPDLAFAVDPDTLPRRAANFVSGLESMPVSFTPSRPLLQSHL